MSVRAYRVKTIDTEDSPLFNLWHDREVMDVLEQHGFMEQLNQDACGVTYISPDAMKDVIKHLTAQRKEAGTKEDKERLAELIKNFQAELKSSPSGADYYCY